MEIPQEEYDSRIRFAELLMKMRRDCPHGLSIASWHSWVPDGSPLKAHYLPLLAIEHPEFERLLIDMGLSRGASAIRVDGTPDKLIGWLTPHLEHGAVDADLLLARYTLMMAGG